MFLTIVFVTWQREEKQMGINHKKKRQNVPENQTVQMKEWKNICTAYLHSTHSCHFWSNYLTLSDSCFFPPISGISLHVSLPPQRRLQHLLPEQVWRSSRGEKKKKKKKHKLWHRHAAAEKTQTQRVAEVLIKKKTESVKTVRKTPASLQVQLGLADGWAGTGRFMLIALAFHFKERNVRILSGG